MKRHFNFKFSLKEEKEIVRLYKLGNEFNSSTLAKKFGCSWLSILKIVRRHGVKTRNNREAHLGYQINEKHGNYKGGCVGNGYKRIPAWRKGKRCIVLEHRHLMEQKIGRLLESSESVHHINGNKLDNRLENLMIVSRSEHGYIHIKERRRKRGTFIPGKIKLDLI